MLMAKAPGSWSSFLAKVIGLGSRLWLYAQFQWIWLASFNGYGWQILLAQGTGLGCWPRLLVHVVDPCYWRRPQVDWVT